MIIAFFGHSDFFFDNYQKDCFLKMLEDSLDTSPAEFYIGGYGGFDTFARNCCLEFKKVHKNAKVILVTPYITLNKNLEAFSKECDEVLYPSLESVPPKFAISARNRWMADKADIIICYVNHAWGGAYTACKYCVTKGKKLINLGSLCFPK